MLQVHDLFTSASLAYQRTEVESRREPFIGQIFFPNRKKAGIDLKWIKTHKGLNAIMKTSNFDSVPALRTRQGLSMTQTEMPLFRESMIVKETDMMEIQRALDSNDPYVAAALADIYDDANVLIDGADIAVERMRMQLLSGNGGNPGITLGTADNMIHHYDYDSDGTWKKSHYMELTDEATWDKAATAKPLDDLQTAIEYLQSQGVSPQYMLTNSTTFRYLAAAEQIRNTYVSKLGAVTGFLTTSTISSVITDSVGVTPLVYNKMFVDYDNAEKKFYPDGYVTIIGSGQLGSTWYGTTPEERTLLGSTNLGNVDISVLDRGVALAVMTEYKPSVVTSTTVSQLALPSFEGMDSIFVFLLYFFVFLLFPGFFFLCKAKPMEGAPSVLLHQYENYKVIN